MNTIRKEAHLFGFHDRPAAKNRTQAMLHIHLEFQQISSCVVLMNTICKKAHLLDLHGHAATHKLSPSAYC